MAEAQAFLYRLRMVPFMRRTGRMVGALCRSVPGRSWSRVLALAGAGCGSSSHPAAQTSTTTVKPGTAPREPGAGKPAVTIGTKNFTEEFILGQLYAQALRAKGYSVTLKNDIGPSEVMDRGLASAAIDGYPEYTGTILSVFGHDVERPASAAEAYRLATAVERQHNATLLAMAPAEDNDVVITTPAYANAHGLQSLADLVRLGPSVNAGRPS